MTVLTDGVAPDTTVEADIAPVEPVAAPVEPVVNEPVINSGDPSTWNWGEGVPGTGEKPDYFNSDKYANIEAQAKAQPEAEKMLGSFTGSPKDGQYNVEVSDELADAGFTIADDDPMLAKALEFAKDSNMNQEGFTNLVDLYGQIKVAESEMREESESTYATEQMKILGNDGQSQVQDILDWASVNLDEDNQAGISDLSFSASGVKVLQALIAKSQGGALSPSDYGQANVDIEAEMKEMYFAEDQYSNRKMSTDLDHKAKYDALATKLARQS
jgi:hypothetical protein